MQIAKRSVTLFNLLNIQSPFCLITEFFFLLSLWFASCSLLFSEILNKLEYMWALECPSLDNQEVTAQRLISVRFQIRETIKEMCLGRKDQWNRSYCLSLQVWCQTVWQSLHVTADLPLLPCWCGAVTRLSDAWVLSLLLCSYSCLPPRSDEWAALRWKAPVSLKVITALSQEESEVVTDGQMSGDLTHFLSKSGGFPFVLVLPFSCSSYLPH